MNRQLAGKHNWKLAYLLLPALLACAIWLWTAPLRAARSLEHATLDSLLVAVKRDPYAPWPRYYLGLRLQQLGQWEQADHALEGAARLDTANERFWLAWAALRSAAHHDTDARAILTQFLHQRPNSAPAHLALAWIWDRAQAHENAVAEARRATELAPGKAEAWRLLASDEEALRRYPDAEQALRQGIAVEPQNGGCDCDMGDFLVRRLRYVDAVTYYRNAARLMPTEARIHLALGQALLQTAQTPAAINAARAALQASARLQPEDLRAWVGIGEAYNRGARWQEAMEALRHRDGLPRANPDTEIKCSYQMLRALRGLGDTIGLARETAHYQHISVGIDSITGLIHAAKAKPADLKRRLLLARACVSNADYDTADAVYRKLLEVAPANQAAAQELAALERAHPEAGRQFAATPLLRVAATSPAPASGPPTDSQNDLLNQAEHLRLAKRYVEAKAAYTRLLARDRNCAPALQGLGLTLDALADREGAFTCLHVATTLDPKLVEATRRLAEYYRQAGFPGQARLEYEKVVRASPGDAQSWHALGQLCSGSNLAAAEAEGAFRHAVELSPESASYTLDLADLLVDQDRPQEAEALYRRALVIAPASEDVLSRVGGFLVSGQPTPERQAEGESLLRQALARNGRNDYTLYSLGHLALLRHQYRPAIALLSAAAKQAPNTKVVWFELANAYRRVGDASGADHALAICNRLQEAFRVYSSITSRVIASPRDPRLRLQLARLSAQQSENAQAINQYRLCLHLDPNNATARQELAALTTRLQSEGRMPPMAFYNAMAATISHRQ